MNVMKKIFTLLFAVGMVSVAAAQPRNFDHGKQDAGYAANTYHPGRERFNKQYDPAIGNSGMNRHLDAREKANETCGRERKQAKNRFLFHKNNYGHSENRVANNSRHER
jgi:hypothetical protein